MSSTKENFISKPADFEEIINNSKQYIVPKYQRDYTWDNKGDEWDLLWNDITSKDKQHYVGILVFQENGDNINIIDGQQRLTTITIILMAALYLLSETIFEITDQSELSNAEKQLELLLNTYIARQNPKDLKYYGKIILNKNNKDFFSTLCDINTNKSLENIKTKKKESKSNKTILEALKYFYSEIKEYLNIINADTIIEFIDENINKKLIFTIINVSNTENAYKLFETLNSRAVELSAFDLLKNHLLSKAGSDQELSMLEDLEKITNNTGGDNNITKFIALDWNSRNMPKTPEKRIYRKISDTILDSRGAFLYTRNLIKSSETYSKIINLEFDDKEINELLKILQYAKIRQHYMILLPLLQSQNKKYNHNKIIKALLILALRYNYVGQGQANKQESVYNIIAYKIRQNKYTDTKDIFKEIRESGIYPSKAEFIEKFTAKDYTSEKLDRYILAKIQEKLNPTMAKIDYDNMTIEHIKDKSSKTKYKSKIGNYLLLKETINGSLSTSLFEKKKEIYQQDSTHPFLIDILSKSTWQETDVEERSRKLAKIANDVFSMKELEA